MVGSFGVRCRIGIPPPFATDPKEFSTVGWITTPMERSMRILIVEDELLIALDVEMALEDAGHVVVGTATTEDEAVEMAVASVPDLMVVDLRLADGSCGRHAVARIRKDQDVLVIFASGNLDPAMRDRLHVLEPVAMLSKPYAPSEIVQAVAKVA